MARREKKSMGFWRRMLLSYMTITLLCFILYIIFVVAGSANLGRAAWETAAERAAADAEIIIRSKNAVANEIINRVNYSAEFRDVYLSLVMGREATTLERTTAANSLINSYVRNVYEGVSDIVLATDGSSTVYAASGNAPLAGPFGHMSFPSTYVTFDSIDNLLGLSTNKVTFREENLLYVTSFRYQGGLERGVIAISFNVDSVVAQLCGALGDAAWRLTYNKRPIVSVGTPGEDEAMVVGDPGFQNIQLEIWFTPYSASDILRVPMMWVWFGFGALFYLVMTGLCLVFTRRHYRPIREVRQLVGTDSGVSKGEIEDMLGSLKDMVIARDEYRSGLEGVRPLVESGIVHDLMLGRKGNLAQSEAGRAFGFSRPWYYIIAANLDTGDEEDLLAVPEALSGLRKLVSGEERDLTWYRRDARNFFCSVFDDSQGSQEQVVDRAYAYLSGSFSPSCRLTFGVDRVRSDLGEYAEACSGALAALDLMLVQGKGEIYWAEDMAQEKGEWRVPPNFDVTLAKAIRAGGDCSEEMSSLLEANLKKCNLSARDVRDLSGELWYCVTKAARALGVGDDIPRADGQATVEEVFATYSAALARLAGEHRQFVGGGGDPYSEIADYVDSNYPDRNLSLSSVAERFGISGKTITNYFQRRYGESWQRHLTRVRMDAAKEILLRTGAPVEEVAEAVGYTNLSTFRRNFKEETGLTPSEWRAKNAE